MDLAKKKRHHVQLKTNLLAVTTENTKLLTEIAALKSQHMKINAEIKEASSYNEKRRHSPAASENKAKSLTLATRQEQEIELLKLEIKSLRTKCGHVSVDSL